MSQPERVSVRCPHCQRLVGVPASLLGKTVHCPRPGCKKPITLSAPAAPAPVPAVPVPVVPVPAVPALLAPAIRRGPMVAAVAGGGVLAVTLMAIAVVGFSGADRDSKEPPVAATLRQAEADLSAEAEPGPVSLDDKNQPGENPLDKSATTIMKPDVELPPLGATGSAAGDPVMREFKTARAIYREARQKARMDLEAKYIAARRQFGLVPMKVGIRSIAKGGPIPDDPEMQGAVAEYMRNLTAAARIFAAVAEKGLAEYAKAGATDPAKLRPLMAARLAGQHPEFIGIWNGRMPLPSVNVPGRSITPGYSLTWHIDVDETSGGWLVSGMERGLGGLPRAAYRGEKVEFKDGALTFVVIPLDKETGQPKKSAAETAKGGADIAQPQKGRNFPRPRPRKSYLGKGVKLTTIEAGTTVTLALRDGQLSCQIDGPSPSTALLQRTDEEHLRYYLDRYENRVIAIGVDALADKGDTTDPNYLWRRIAQLSSFGYYRGDNNKMVGPEALYLPYRSVHLAKGSSIGLINVIRRTPSPEASDRNQNTALLREYAPLLAASHPYLQRAAEQALALCRARLRLAMACEEFGNTASSQMLVFEQKVWIPGMQYLSSRERDFERSSAKLREQLMSSEIGRAQLRGEYGGTGIRSEDVPMSEETREKLREFIHGISGGAKDEVKERGRVTGLLAYADMQQADRTADFWHAWLLPLARRCAGPVGNKPFAKVDAGWTDLGTSKGKLKILSAFRFQNVSGQDLSHVVVELIAENEWGEKASHYYYIDRLDIGDYVWLAPHPRWEKRRLPFTRKLIARWSLWADEGTELGGEAKLINPTPSPVADESRKSYLAYDRQYQAQGEAFGAVMQYSVRLPVVPELQRSLLRLAGEPKKTYVFCLPDKSDQILVFRFLRYDRHQDAFEAEIFDPVTRKPFRDQTPVWKGKLTPGPEQTISFSAGAASNEPGWSFAFERDDQPKIVCAATNDPGAVFSARDIPLFAVKLP
jgi:hypothetical protein